MKGAKAIGAVLLLAPLVIGTEAGGTLRRVLGHPALLYLGSISYGIYLWHFPLLHAFGGLVRHGELFTTVALTAITVLVASLSWFLVERPAQRFVPRYLARRTTPAAAAPLSP